MKLLSYLFDGKKWILSFDFCANVRGIFIVFATDSKVVLLCKEYIILPKCHDRKIKRKLYDGTALEEFDA